MKIGSAALVALFFVTLLSCNSNSEYKTVATSDAQLHLDNGVLYYDDQPFEGVTTSTFPNGNRKSTTTYAKGRKNGLEETWYANKQLASTRTYTKGMKTGIHKGWWENKLPKFEYYFNDKGEYNGTVKEWYESGQAYSAFHYKNGKEDGSQKMWNPEGKIKANYEVRKNESFGLIGLKKCNSVKSTPDEIQ